jgi:7-alpha-hydroxysteroid dehydrogenase
VTVNVEHYDLSGRNAVVIGNVRAIVDALATAYEEAGALTTRILCRPAEASARLVEAIAAHGSLDVLATGFDLFLARPLEDTTPDDVAQIMLANCASQFAACRLAVAAMRQQHHGGNLVVVTNVLGERGLPNTSAYAASHGAVHNFVRAAAQELAPMRIVINGIALGWMAWMDDRLDPADPEAARALRFPIVKGPGRPSDLGPLAVWLSGSGAGYVTGQIFPLDGGLTQHL